PPESDYLVYLLPKGEASASTALEAAMKYYRESFTEFKNLAKGSEIFQSRVEAPILEGYNNGLAGTLRMAQEQGYSPADAAHLIKGMAWCFHLDEYKGKIPEYLFSLLSHLTPKEDRQRIPEVVTQLRVFWGWVDQTIQAADISQNDIDLAWRSIISQYLEGGIPQVENIDEKTQESVRKAIIAQTLDVLPDRTRASILSSYVGQQLDKRFGWKAQQQYLFTTQQGETVIERTLSESQIDAALMHRLRSRLVEGSERVALDDAHVWVRQRNADRFFVLMEFFPDFPKVSKESASGVIKVVNIFVLFRHPEKEFRLRAWETGLAKFQKINRDESRWHGQKAPLLSSEGKTWQDAAEKCIRLLLSDEDIAADIFTESVQIGVDFLIQLTSELKPRDVKQWFHLPDVKFEGEKALVESARLISLKFSDNWEDLYRLRRFAYHSLFSDAAVFRKRVVEGFRRNGSKPQDMPEWADRLLVEGEQNPSRIYKINIVLTLLEWARSWKNGPKDEKDAKKQEREFWPRISPGGRSKRPQHRASELLSQALALRVEEREPIALAAIGETLGGILSLVWLDEDNLTPPMRRYVAAVVSGFLTTRLVEMDAFRSAEDPWAIWEGLFQVEWSDDAPGLFRPILARYLRYSVAYAVHELRGYESTVQAYLMNDELQKQFLDIGEWYRVISGFLGDADTLKPIWLDAALDQSPTAGVDTFLQNCAGTSLSYWPKALRQRLERLSNSIEFDHEREMSALFKRITDDASDAEILPILQNLSFFISLGVHTRPPHWGQWLRRCLDESVLRRLVRSPDLYHFFIRNFAVVISIPELENETKDVFRNMLLASPDQLHSPEQLIAHARTLVFLLQMNWRDDAIGKWLNNVANDDGLPLELRRKCVAAFTEAWHQLPFEVRTQLEPALVHLAQTPPWNNLTETLLFRRSKQ
ncbi:MAG: hypothetical protein O7E52_24815, partial [Candidatus Poribacteria bacterium]|nr:hypothetical protein [Candidatus Poribacteria bacterium]